MEGFGGFNLKSDRRRPRFVSAIAVAAFVLGVCAQSSKAAEVIQFPQEELATESVLPVFDKPVSVLNRNILTAKRLELGLVGGLSLLEPFYNPYSYGLTGSYNFSEEHGIEVLAVLFMQGLSSNGQNLNPIPGKTPPTNVNLQYAPSPQYLLLGNYQFTGFYGKISLAKDFIMHLTTYGLAGGGVIGVGDSVNPILSAGIGEKLYFSPTLALRLDLRFMLYQGPDVLSKPLDTATGPRPASEFSQKLNYMSLLSVGFVYLFPEM